MRIALRSVPYTGHSPDVSSRRLYLEALQRADRGGVRTRLGEPGTTLGALNEDSTVIEQHRDPDATRQLASGDASLPIDMPRGPLGRGDSVGRYVVITKVGVGGFGEVYSAYDPDLDRKVALKIMKTRENRLGTARVQLSREAQALAKLSHENVLTVYDFGDFDGDVFLAMEFVDGQTLKDWFLSTHREWREVLDVMLHAGRGLAAAHNAGIVHSDFKPHNILIDKRGRVRVADFGLAKALQQLPPMGVSLEDSLDDEIRRRRTTTIPRVSAAKSATTSRPLVAGSPAYMAPEQFRGRDVDERSDQFAFCVTLFEGLYGRRPFTQRTVAELKAAVLAGAIEDPPLESDVPRWIRDVILRGLSLDPHDRFESMDELLGALSIDPIQRAKRIRRTAVTIVASAIGTLTAAAIVYREPTPDEINQIETLTVEARAAAARNYFVTPPVEEPSYPTAYRKVLELESLDGGYDPRADDVADELRKEFAQTLTRIGDYYWEAEYGKPFALDYYMHAYIFDPSNERARERSEVTPGEVRRMVQKASELDFTHGELVAAEPLSVLAMPELKRRAEALRELKEKKRRRSFTSQARLDLVTQVTDAIARKEGPDSDRKNDSEVPSSKSAVTDDEGMPLVSVADGFKETLPAENSEFVQNILTVSNPAPKQANGGNERGSSTSDTRAPSNLGKVDSEPTDSSLAARLVSEARLLLGRAKLEEAAQTFHRAIRANRRNSAALMGLSDTYFEMGQYQKAVEYGERAVALSGRRSSYRWKLGDAYVRVLRYKDAAEQYRIGANLGSTKAKRRLVALQEKLGE